MTKYQSGLYFGFFAQKKVQRIFRRKYVHDIEMGYLDNTAAKKLPGVIKAYV